MLLSYIDESGINYRKVNSFFIDGPYIIWSAILIPENKYFHTERMFCDIARYFLKVKDWQRTELHATNIWRQTDEFSTISSKKISLYFEELFQLLAKLNLKVVVSVEQKNPRIRSRKSKKRQIEKSIYAFLHGIEHQLSLLNESTVLIADETSQPKTQYSDMERLLFDRVKWRNNPGVKQSFKFKPKYRFEALSCFILDQVNYSDSKKSLFLQLEDHVCFVLQRVFTYMYLSQFPKPNFPADETKVPISPNTFKFFVHQTSMLITNYNDNIKDVNLTTLDRSLVYGNDSYLNLNLQDFTPFK